MNQIQVSTKCKSAEELQSMLLYLQKSGYVAEIKSKSGGFILYRQYREGECDIPSASYWSFDGKSFERNENHKINKYRQKINRRLEPPAEQSFIHRKRGMAE